MHKIFKILVAVISLVGVVSLVTIISKGNDAIETAAQSGDTGIVEPIAISAYIMLASTIGFVLFFVIKNLVTNTAGLKNTLVSVGAFLGVLIISYLLSGGDLMDYKNGDTLATSSESHMVGAGLTAFYFLLVIAAIAMLFTGVKKIISK
jgi:hypothetical protein